MQTMLVNSTRLEVHKEILSELRLLANLIENDKWIQDS
jgi:hypothetical protein